MDGGEEPFFKRPTRYLDTVMKGLRHFEYAQPAEFEEPLFYRAAPPNRPRRRATGPMEYYRDMSRRRVGEGDDDFGGEEGMEAVDFVPPPAAVGPPLPDSPPEAMDFENPDQVAVMAGDPGVVRRLVRSQAVGPELEDLSRWQDKQSNSFKYFRIRGGLPNYQLLDAPRLSTTCKYHITQYPHYVEGQTAPKNASNFIYPFSAGNANSIDPLATSCQYLSGMYNTETMYYIAYGCLNAVSHEVAEFATDVYGFYGGHWRGIPCNPDMPTVLLGPTPNIFCLPDPEHWCPKFGVSGYFDGIWHDIPNARYTWPYDSIYHRASSSISMHNLRISGTVRAQQYQASILCEAPLINNVYWANYVRYVRPVIYIIVYLHYQRSLAGAVHFDDVIDGIGNDVATTQVPMGTLPVHDSVLHGYTSVVPRLYTELPSDCKVLAFECIDMSGNESSYNTSRYVTFAPGYTVPVNPVLPDVQYIVPADSTSTYSEVDMPYEERPFVFDIDLNGLVVNFRKDSFNYLRPSLAEESKGVSMLTSNSIHIAAYCQYPGFPTDRGFDTTDPSPERLSYCQPISIGYTSHLTFTDFLD